MKNLRPYLMTPLFAVIGRSGGILVPFFIAHFYGVSRETDAFFFACAIVMFFWGVFQQVFETVLLPFHAENKRQGKEALMAFLRRVLYVTLPFAAMGCFALRAALPGLLGRTSGLDAESTRIVSETFTLLIPFLLLTVWISAINGVLNSYKAFWFPAFSPFIRSAVIVAGMYLFHEALGIYAIPAGFVAGELFRWGLSLVVLWRLGFWGVRGRQTAGKAQTAGFWQQSGYQILALGAVQIIPLINQWCVSWLGVGDLSLYNYAERLYQIPFQLFLTGQSQIFFSHWADSYFAQSRQEFVKRVHRSLGVALLVVIGCAMGFWLFRHLLVRLAFGFGEVPPETLSVISNLFGWLIISLPAAVANTLLLRVLFVMRKSAGFLLQSVARLGFQIGLNVLLMRFYGIEGVGMATLLSVGITTLLLYLHLLWLWRKESL